MGIKPLYDRVLIQRIESDDKSAGGIIIPDSAKEKPLEGIVRSAGPGKLNDDGSHANMQVQEGDKVLFGKYAGTEITVAGEEHLILREDEILAVIDD